MQILYLLALSQALQGIQYTVVNQIFVCKHLEGYNRPLKISNEPMDNIYSCNKISEKMQLLIAQ